MIFWPIVQRFFQTQDIKKKFLARLYHRANYQQNRLTNELFMNNFNFFSTPEEKKSG
jgi:hypothetical protein